MGGRFRIRWRDFVVPLVVWSVMAMAAAGCDDSPSSSSAAPAQGVSAQGMSAASVTPEAFRNLGKRAESVF